MNSPAYTLCLMDTRTFAPTLDDDKPLGKFRTNWKRLKLFKQCNMAQRLSDLEPENLGLNLNSVTCYLYTPEEDIENFFASVTFSLK